MTMSMPEQKTSRFEMQYAVWPTSAPPVPANKWDQTSWRNFDERFRPADYSGGIYDQEAWNKYLKENAEKERDAFYAKYGMERVSGTDAFRQSESGGVCPECSQMVFERYAVTVASTEKDPGLWRCPSGHIAVPIAHNG